MIFFQLLADASGGNLGTFQAPSAAFAPDVTVSGIEAASALEKIASLALGGITLVAAVYFLFVLVIAGFTWMGAAGDAGKITKARDSMTNGIIGLVIIIAAYSLIGAVGSMLGINILKFGGLLTSLRPEINNSYTGPGGVMCGGYDPDYNPECIPPYCDDPIKCKPAPSNENNQPPTPFGSGNLIPK
ncbi:pilin [Patescibacteria group bacterium]|nr:pilin [Patescibacteria group bacterium]